MDGKIQEGFDMAKDRTPTSKSSWIGMAAHEIDEITTYGASRAARHARDLADAVVRAGRDLLQTDPRALARANFSPAALQAARNTADERRRETARILGTDQMAAWLRFPTKAQIAA
jgi:hypothetical protein